MSTTSPYCPEPGYYRSDLRRLSFREIRRMAPGGIVGAALVYLLRGTLPVSLEGPWIPLLWDDLVVEREDLSYTCQVLLEPLVAELEALGFRVAAYQRMRDHLFPLQVDNGGAFLLHESGRYGGSVLWSRMRSPNPGGEDNRVLAVWLFTACPSGSSVSVTNSRMYMDPPAPREIVCLNDAPAAALWERIQAERRRLDSRREATLPLRTVEDLAFLHDARELESWQDRIERRRVLVRMTDDQVEEARRKMAAQS